MQSVRVPITYRGFPPAIVYAASSCLFRWIMICGVILLAAAIVLVIVSVRGFCGGWCANAQVNGILYNAGSRSNVTAECYSIYKTNPPTPYTTCWDIGGTIYGAGFGYAFGLALVIITVILIIYAIWLRWFFTRRVLKPYVDKPAVPIAQSAPPPVTSFVDVELKV